MSTDFSLQETFCGSTTVGERGQVVIPSEARRKLGIQHGDKLLVMVHPARGVFLCKIECIRDVLALVQRELAQISEIDNAETVDA